MDPVTLISSALALATPYLIKTGESIAEKIGEDIWTLIKRPFSKDKHESFTIDLTNEIEKEKLIHLLTEKIEANPEFKDELEIAVEKGERELAAYQQNIHNNGKIEKQINIQQNSGNIKM